MAVIPAGNGTDPWTLLRDYVKGQDTDRRRREDMDFRMQQQDMQLSSAEERARLANDPAVQYAKTDARLKARIANGFGPRSTAPKDLTGSKAAAQFRAGLLEGGITNPYAIATLMGNAQNESQFDPNAVGDRTLGPGREAHGSMQWREGRWQALQQFAAAKGMPVDDPKTQGMFAAHELTQNPQYRGIGEQLQQLKDLRGGQPLMRKYLGYNTDVANEPHREATAAMWLKKDIGVGGGKPPTELAAYETGLKRDPADPTHIYTADDGRKYQMTQMPTSRANDLKQEMRRKYKQPGETMVELDLNAPLKNGMPTYKIYTAPSSAPAAVVPAAPVPAPVPVPTEQQAAVDPVTTAAVEQQDDANTADPVIPYTEEEMQ